MTDPKSEWKAGDRVRLKLCKMRHRYAWARVNWWLFWWLFADRCGGVPSWLDRITERARAAQLRYEQSESRKAAKERYCQSEHGKAIRSKYVQSEQGKAARRRKALKSVHELSDSYVRDLLSFNSNIHKKSWPTELVELKRTIIKTKRLCKNQKTLANSETPCLTLTNG